MFVNGRDVMLLWSIDRLPTASGRLFLLGKNVKVDLIKQSLFSPPREDGTYRSGSK